MTKKQSGPAIHQESQETREALEAVRVLLWQDGLQPIAQLAKTLGLSSANTSQHIARLVAKGEVRQVPLPGTKARHGYEMIAQAPAGGLRVGTVVSFDGDGRWAVRRPTVWATMTAGRDLLHDLFFSKGQPA